MSRLKIPESVLVVIHTPALEVLLIRRTGGDGQGGEFWQSVTGSKDFVTEDWRATAIREVQEETGMDCGPASALSGQLRDWELENIYPIYPRWLHRYPEGVTHNTERLFSLQVPAGTPVQLSPREHTAYQWLPHRAAADACYAPSNAEAILLLPHFVG